MAVVVTIDRFEGTQAVLVLPDGQTFSLEREELPVEAHEGAQFYLELNDNPAGEGAARDQARDLLNGILNKR
jgi:hypothetical protein